MDIMLLANRLIHIVSGIFWAGTLIFMALFLQPSLRDAGPDGSKVAAGLLRRRFLDVMPIVALVTILSGFWLYWRVSGGFANSYMGSRAGMAYGLAGVASVLAFGIGVGVMRPATLRAASLSRQVAATSGPNQESLLAAAQALRARAAKAGKVVAALLALASVTMALGRYL